MYAISLRSKKALAILLAIALIFSFNMAFAQQAFSEDAECNWYQGNSTPTGPAQAWTPPSPEENTINQDDAIKTQTFQGTTVSIVFNGQNATITVIEGALGSIDIKAATNFRTWVFAPAVQAGECVTVSSVGILNNGGQQPAISHITWYVGEVVVPAETGIKIIKTKKVGDQGVETADSLIKFYLYELDGEGVKIESSKKHGFTDSGGILKFYDLEPGNYLDRKSVV